MKKINIITLLFPAVLMSLITIITFSGFETDLNLDFKGIFIISLMIVFPLMFLIQGIICSIKRTNIILSLGISSLTFLILVTVYLNESGYSHLKRYLICGVIGYVIPWGVSKFKPNKGN